MPYGYIDAGEREYYIESVQKSLTHLPGASLAAMN